MPEQRPPFRVECHPAPRPPEQSGFTSTNTSGLDDYELAALNLALVRLIDAGLTEYQGKVALDYAVREWLVPADAADADVERVIAGWRR